MHPASSDHHDTGRILVVCGPTATGKTRLALHLAQQCGGEIVGADSRQVYRHLDIGTAKPTPAQRALAPHHLIDVVDPDEPFTLADYLDRARPAVAGILARGRVPIVAGGTGLYIRALVRGFDVPRVPPNPALRRELEDIAAAGGAGALLERLRRADPDAAVAVDRDNPRRLIRAIEVAEASPEPYSRADSAGPPQPTGIAGDAVDAGVATEVGRTLALPVDGPLASKREGVRGYDALIIGLTADRAALHERADRRVDAMMAEGFLDEVRSLYARGYAPDLPALSSLGYRELGEFLAEEQTGAARSRAQAGTGAPTLEGAAQATKWATHRFIRRQLTWFRREPTIQWLDITAGRVADEAARLCARWLSPSAPARTVASA